MSWVKIDDALLDNEKILTVGPLGLALYVAGLTHAARNLTDGRIPAAKARTLLDWTDLPISPEAIMDRLVEVGLWEKVPGGFQINDYLEYNPSRESVLKQREATAARVAVLRQRGPARRRGAVSNAVGNSVTSGVRTPDVTPDVRPYYKSSTDCPDPDPQKKIQTLTQRAGAREETPMSSDAEAIRCAIVSHPALAAIIDPAALANQLAGARLAKGTPLAWILTAVAEAARDVGAESAGGGAMAPALVGRRVAAYAARARPPGPPRGTAPAVQGNPEGFQWSSKAKNAASNAADAIQ